MFIVDTRNIDYLIEPVRFHIGDFTEPYRFDDAVIRTAIINAVQALQRRWKYRYLLFTSGIVIHPLPSGYWYEGTYTEEDTVLVVVPSGYLLGLIPESVPGFIPSGLQVYDVFKNPFQVYVDPDAVVSQEDEVPVILMASILLRKAQLSSSADAFASWSDGEFSYSNLGYQRALIDLLKRDMEELDRYFKLRLSSSQKTFFARIDSLRD
jgi:hypothetical protein